jgi:hypothetical protein
MTFQMPETVLLEDDTSVLRKFLLFACTRILRLKKVRPKQVKIFFCVHCYVNAHH